VYQVYNIYSSSGVHKGCDSKFKRPIRIHCSQQSYNLVQWYTRHANSYNHCNVFLLYHFTICSANKGCVLYREIYKLAAAMQTYKQHRKKNTTHNIQHKTYTGNTRLKALLRVVIKKTQTIVYSILW